MLMRPSCPWFARYPCGWYGCAHAYGMATPPGLCYVWDLALSLFLFVKSLFKGYSVEQKRAVFFKFVELFHDQNFPQELKAKVCTTARRSVDLSRFLRKLPALLLGLWERNLCTRLELLYYPFHGNPIQHVCLFICCFFTQSVYVRNER